MRGDDAVEGYLDDLFDNLTGTGGPGRRALGEAEDHLHSAREELVAAGVPAEEASARAVRRFGDASQIALGLRVAHRDLGGLARQLFSGAWLLGAIGLVTIGISGGLAALMRVLWGARFMAGDVDGVTYTAARCRDYLEYHPVHSCSTAAALHHSDELVSYRVLIGVLGLLALGLYLLARRIGPLKGGRWAVPRGPLTLVALALFGIAAVGAGGTALLTLMLGTTTGTGNGLSAGVVAGLAALGAGVVGTKERLART